MWHTVVSWYKVVKQFHVKVELHMKHTKILTSWCTTLVKSMIDIYAAQLLTIPLLCNIFFVTNQNQSRQGDRADQKRM